MPTIKGGFSTKNPEEMLKKLEEAGMMPIKSIKKEKNEKVMCVSER